MSWMLKKASLTKNSVINSALLHANWRESLPVMEFHHPPNSPWILAAIPESQDRHTVRSWFLFLLVFGIWLAWGFHRFLFFHQPTRHWHWIDVIVRCIFPFSNQHFAYCRWRRWGWRRWGRMTLLFHRCPWGWWRCRGRTCQARNHDRNEVLCVALYPNTVFLWDVVFWPLIHSYEYPCSSQSFPSDKTAGVSSRLSLSRKIQLFDINCGLFMRLHFTIGCYDCRWTFRRRQSFQFSRIQVLFADLVHRRSGVYNKFSFLRFKGWCRQAPIFRRWEECCSLVLL